MNGSKLDSTALAVLQQNAHEQFGPAMREWKSSGGKIIGLLYNLVPEEIVTAAGILPYRLRAVDSNSSVLADARFSEVNCSLVRHYYDHAARGGFHFLDGLVASNACDHERRLYDNWTAALGIDYGYFMRFPKKAGAEQVENYLSQLVKFRESIEAAFGVEITDAKLRAAITLHNETRRLQRELYELRRLPNPPITGAEVLSVMMAATSMPRDKYNAVLGELIEDCKRSEGHTDYKLRAFVYGGEFDSVSFLEMVEGQGVLVVGDSLGFGYRAAFSDIGDTGDPLYDIAYNLVMERPAEPRIFGTADSRQDFVRDQMEEFGASAVILPHLPMCDFWGFEKHNFDAYAKANNIPVLSLSVEYLFGDTGQMKTRVQAFVETFSEGSL